MTKVCAHTNHGSAHGYARDHGTHQSEAAARRWFEDTRREYPPDPDQPATMDVYHLDPTAPPCKCDSAMNFHDYPTTRYETGPRGGIRKTTT